VFNNSVLYGQSRIVSLQVPRRNYTVCVDESTRLPELLSRNVKNIKVLTKTLPTWTFLSAEISAIHRLLPDPAADCAAPGKADPGLQFGGVVYPGCSLNAEGGNWNVVSHNDGCISRDKRLSLIPARVFPTKSPKVTSTS